MSVEKPTEGAGRSYRDACAAARALDRLGERWALLVLRELSLGPRRFTELRHGLPAISANVLAQRLEGLEAAGILERSALPPPATHRIYALTCRGAEALPILDALARWGTAEPVAESEPALSAASLILLLRNAFDPDRAAGFKKRLGLRTDGRNFLLRVRKRRLLVEEAELGAADCILAGRPETVASLLRDQTLDGLVADGRLAIEDDPAVAEKMLRFFSLT